MEIAGESWLPTWRDHRLTIQVVKWWSGDQAIKERNGFLERFSNFEKITSKKQLVY